MDIPKITMTMLGVPASGKTTFLHGMYAMLSTGIRGYFVYTQDPDDDIDLAADWKLFCDEGRLPDATNEDPKAYNFEFLYGFDPLLHIDCVDFRGGAAIEMTKGPSAKKDVDPLHKRLKESDSIYLVLDSRYLAEWINAGTPENWNPGSDHMRVARLGRLISQAIRDRIKESTSRPSIVILITKSDVLAQLTGKSKVEALQTAVRNLKNLVPLAYWPGITALICPITLGSLGTEIHKCVDPADIHPQNLHKPIVFSLWHYLTTRDLTELEHDRVEVEDRIESNSRELSNLRAGFMSSLFKRGRIRSLDEAVNDDTDRLGQIRDGLGDAQHRAELLAQELDGLPIIEDGRLLQKDEEEL